MHVLKPSCLQPYRQAFLLFLYSTSCSCLCVNKEEIKVAITDGNKNIPCIVLIIYKNVHHNCTKLNYTTSLSKDFVQICVKLESKS